MMDSTTNAQNVNSSETTETKVDYKIAVSTPAEFGPVADVCITTTNELGKLINEVFKQAFGDYFGCVLDVQFQPNIGYIVIPNLIFKVLKAEAYESGREYAFSPLFTQNKGAIVERVQRLSKISTSNGVRVDISDNGKSALEEFVIGDPRKIDWNSAFNVFPSETDTYIRVFKLDISKILKLIFGSEDERGSKLYYQITPTFKTGINAQYQYKTADNWVVNILRLNDANQKASLEAMGMLAPSDGFLGSVNTSTLGK